jgi:hypothetical protein
MIELEAQDSFELASKIPKKVLLQTCALDYFVKNMREPEFHQKLFMNLYLYLINMFKREIK